MKLELAKKLSPLEERLERLSSAIPRNAKICQHYFVFPVAENLELPKHYQCYSCNAQVTDAVGIYEPFLYTRKDG